ncbi:probable disease resistance protein At4g27220 [Magnolia sinica]|uniref:probable disease resistance protein At4g27220 n=1 Tax=Magnolia sinica TaxID=86752 RepID=UPI00265B035D|nr:probable disease resistance protein At4g27220 [Magnolia sinica]XP_058106041.1 probable disease resistance protein At4g27220 [Magnolia sinica]XP_058106042.1 probable disease resistance protein At4g27220 [Magnolia sinica]XP_058106043.1 probable disease resistance protein At4g27220 [Magnolia sinica]XP_058106044.1 probable disease resistance protein At4g27220 [Magnolia sinica]XP_058106045.1 probable disease resistance protein At4g27220 [Magnolia sinica]
MDLWEIILFFWAPICRHIGYFKDLNNNVETLNRKTKKLKRKHDEIQAEVEDAIPVGKRQKTLVENWLTEVRNTENQVDSIRLELALRRICTDHSSRYTLGKRVVEKLEDIKKLNKKLKAKGVFDKVAESSRHPRVLEKQTSLPRGQQSTFEQTLEEIWQCLNEEENGIIGICGMGGIGKTTLMKEINNRCTNTRDFDVVIWITVSKDLNLGLIQEEIGNRLGMKFDRNEDKVDKLFARLKNLRYLLILDDLWESFSLIQVGIPKPDKQNRCKIAITSRSVAVCNAMGADKSIKVRALTTEEAWNLFCETCGDAVLLSETRPVAEEVAKECSGLPLAIKTVGGAMRGKDKKEVWRNALRALEGASPEVSGMERQVFLPLKLSYDSLENDEIKSCFLYCSLFPEDYLIPIDVLVRYWAMEEGFIENVNNLEEASNKGHDILERMKDACLLEKVSCGNEFVRMHDLLRDLAIWITSPSSSSIEGTKFLVKAGEGLVQPPEEKMWGGVVRISLICSKIKHLQITPDCPNLVSLFLNQNSQLRTIHSNFFQLMPKLQILDLSATGIESLPMSLLLLVNLRVLSLRYCKDLVEVPPLGKLKELQILDLSESGLKNFPQGIASLVKLKRLDISLTSFTTIPYAMIYGLPSLEEVSMTNLEEHVDGATFSEAVNMKRLRSLSISVSNLNGFIALDMFHRWFSGLTSFHVTVKSAFCLPLSNKQISIGECDKFPCGIEGLIKYAFSLDLYKSKGLTSLSKFQGDLKSLRDLRVDECSEVECIIDWREVGDDAFQCLQRLDLYSLPNLEKVFDGGAPPPLNTSLQNLRRIWVDECEKLRSLFSSSMVEQLHQLEELTIMKCFQMKEIIAVDKLPHNSFPKLRVLRLVYLRELESICSQRFMFISLEEMKVISCPMLKKLPLFSSSIHEIKGNIEGEREWWEGLEWEDEKAKSLYTRIYKGP